MSRYILASPSSDGMTNHGNRIITYSMFNKFEAFLPFRQPDYVLSVHTPPRTVPSERYHLWRQADFMLVGGACLAGIGCHYAPEYVAALQLPAYLVAASIGHGKPSPRYWEKCNAIVGARDPYTFSHVSKLDINHLLVGCPSLYLKNMRVKPRYDVLFAFSPKEAPTPQLDFLRASSLRLDVAVAIHTAEDALLCHDDAFFFC